jgi:5-formyltetrahydrofolate cyclo-ligase
MNKSDLREAIAHRISQLSEKDRAAESRSICRRILEELPKDPVTVCAYYAMPNEVDLKPFLEELLQKGYPLFLPRCESEKLVFRQVHDLSSLKQGSFDIPEPSHDAPALDPQTASHVIIPGRAFTQTGERMGRGNGGYDHWIADQRKINPKTLHWGVCFECQLVPEVPMEAHDERVDAVVTVRGLSSSG